ncbi:hypothetical protein AB0K40_17830 [Nonomuraea bangladeshensis]|uniref:Secreted protein n=1 Tax=Nonomuraea bangladeshensis TaxID=404385 RepID=A0ABV3H4C8_9ACTN
MMRVSRPAWAVAGLACAVLLISQTALHGKAAAADVTAVEYVSQQYVLGANQEVPVVAVCPTGMQVFGGGHLIGSFGSDVYVRGSQPNTNLWRVDFVNRGSTAVVYALAVCSSVS